MVRGRPRQRSGAPGSKILTGRDARPDRPLRATRRDPTDREKGRPVVLGIRPEDIAVGGDHARLTVEVVEDLGAQSRCSMVACAPWPWRPAPLARPAWRREMWCR